MSIPGIVAMKPDDIVMMCKITMIGLYVYDNKSNLIGTDQIDAFHKLITSLLNAGDEHADLYQKLPQEFHIQMKEMAEEITALSQILDKTEINDLLKSLS